MTRRLLLLAVLLTMLGALLGFQASAAIAKNNATNLLEWQTMVGIPDAFTGTKAPIRTINGGGVPWTLTAARGELSTTGELEVVVDGLVLTENLSNPIASFRARVSCLDSDAQVRNVQTDAVAATTGPAASGGGDATIEAQLTLPEPCIAPIVFVTSPGGAWFASTGG